MNNRRVMDLGGGKVKVEQTNEAALETEQARMEEFGPFRVDSLAASQNGVAEKFGAVDANAPTSMVMARGGQIMAIGFDLSTPVTAGTATVQATVGGTASGAAVSIAAASGNGVTELPVPVSFNRGDKLGVVHTTNGAFTPTPHVRTWLLVRWTATVYAGQLG